VDKKLLFIIILTLVFLASNSLLVKWALLQNSIDAYTFTIVRISSGALALMFYVFYKHKRIVFSFKHKWREGLALSAYALSFSFAYLGLDAGLGTLILFSSVQLSMILLALKSKETLSRNKILGLSLAFMGLFYLLYPTKSFEVSYFHSFLIILAGISWAFYSIFAKKAQNILFQSSENFTKASLIILSAYFILTPSTYVSSQGLIFALISGILSSAFAYVLWYFILGKIQIITASIIQLAVPLIAIYISILFFGEDLSLKLILSSTIILFGIFLSLV